jgi:hypothetical protein
LIDAKLRGIRIDHRKQKTAIIAYADDVTILLKSREEIQIVKDAITSYQKASGVKINLAKSKGLAI